MKLFQITSKTRPIRGSRDSFPLPTYFKNKTKGIPEIPSNFFKNQIQKKIFSSFFRIISKTSSTRNSFKVGTSKTKHSGCLRFFKLLQKSHKGSLRFFQNTWKPDIKRLGDSFKLLQTQDLQEVLEILPNYFKNKIQVVLESLSKYFENKT